MTAEELLAFARGLDGVTVETADAASGAPEAAWGDSFVYYDGPGVDREPPDRRWPFATVVVHDYAGFDESSNLDREGVFRVNVNVGKRRFAELLGYPPSRHAEHHVEYDYAVFDTVLPHPEYGQQAWVSVVNPGEETSDLVQTLLTQARDRAAGRGQAGRT